MELTKLPISERARTLIETSIANYQRHARLRLSVDTKNGHVVWCTAHQYEPAPGGRILTDDEIQERAAEAFEPLRAAGITPIICVYTVADGNPTKPGTKHRSGQGYELRGIKGSVLRIAPPRALFTSGAEGVKLIEIEEAVGGHFFTQLAYKANQWAKRGPFREQMKQHVKDIALVDRVEDMIDDKNAALLPYLQKVGLDVERISEYIDDGTVLVQKSQGPNGTLVCEYVYNDQPFARITFQLGKVIATEEPTS